MYGSMQRRTSYDIPSALFAYALPLCFLQLNALLDASHKHALFLSKFMPNTFFIGKLGFAWFNPSEYSAQNMLMGNTRALIIYLRSLTSSL